MNSQKTKKEKGDVIVNQFKYKIVVLGRDGEISKSHFNISFYYQIKWYYEKYIWMAYYKCESKEKDCFYMPGLPKDLIKKNILSFLIYVEFDVQIGLEKKKKLFSLI